MFGNKLILSMHFSIVYFSDSRVTVTDKFIAGNGHVCDSETTDNDVVRKEKNFNPEKWNT